MSDHDYDGMGQPLGSVKPVLHVQIVTDADLVAFALRYLADDCEDHRPRMAERMRKLAERLDVDRAAVIAPAGVVPVVER